jgi:hypothetical protein
MEPDILREIIRQLVDQGRLTGSGIELDGEPVTNSGEPDTEYMPNGWSRETSHGCRRHRLIDKLYARFSNGNRFQREIAENMPLWFCFDPRDLGVDSGTPGGDVHVIEADDEYERNMAREAAGLASIRARWLMSGNMPTDYIASYALREDSDGDGRKEHRVLEDYAVVFTNIEPRQEVVTRWPETQVRRLETQAEQLRYDAELATNR